MREGILSINKTWYDLLRIIYVFAAFQEIGYDMYIHILRFQPKNCNRSLKIQPL